MPISKSAKKSLRSSINKRRGNILLRSKLKKSLKKVTPETLNEAYSVIDKAAKTSLIHKNKAARLKSRLAKKINSPAKVSKISKNSSAKKKVSKKKK